MPSQPVDPSSSCVKIPKGIMEPAVGELLLLRREPTNIKDSQAVSVVKSILGCRACSCKSLGSFSRTCNKGTAVITGARLNRGAG